MWVDPSSEKLAHQDELTLSRNSFVSKVSDSKDVKLVLSSEEHNCLKVARALLVGKGYRLVSLKSAKEVRGIEGITDKERLNSYLQGGFFPSVEGLESVLQRTREVYRLVRKATQIEGAVALVLPRGFASFFLWREIPLFLHPEDLLFRQEVLGGVFCPQFPMPYEAKEL